MNSISAEDGPTNWHILKKKTEIEITMQQKNAVTVITFFLN
jgi:hypothetical protein